VFFAAKYKMAPYNLKNEPQNGGRQAKKFGTMLLQQI